MNDVLLSETLYEDDVYEKALVQAGAPVKNMVVIDADLARATRTQSFASAFPGRYFDVGIAEQNMMGIAAGMAASGKVPVVGTFATFVTKRALDQINVSIAYPRLPVVITGVEPGLSSGRNGATHQAVDDLAILRAMPHMAVVDPADAEELRQAVLAAVRWGGPVYLRVQRGRLPVIFDKGRYRFEIGKGVRLMEGEGVAVISTGIMTPRALKVAEALRAEGIYASLIHLPTLKPLDEELLLETARSHSCLVTAENHSVIGGLFGAVAELCAINAPVPIRPVGIADCFGETGSCEYLDGKYGLDEAAIAKAVRGMYGKYCKS